MARLATWTHFVKLVKSLSLFVSGNVLPDDKPNTIFLRFVWKLA